MQGKFIPIFTKSPADLSDPLRKREEFAISLRKQKTREIIREKRRKLTVNLVKPQNTLAPEVVDFAYNG